MEEYRNLLPKNMRQMGEKEDRVRIYVEDYVCTYFQKLELTTECWRVGVLLGMHEEREGVPCLFISGAVETQAAEYAEGPSEIYRQDLERYPAENGTLLPRNGSLRLVCI